ncbi:hypothetical protein DVH24_036098 [Malus domestica]|uniref:Uncharacterized protein n=1 Tax=Malus domestica TaxID=3750 RepID=A0A498IIA3_MALDO|nr:hypothetical protein DVH24_036098 [Malus domestica]
MSPNLCCSRSLTLVKGETLQRFNKRLGYSSYCQLVLWWNLMVSEQVGPRVKPNDYTCLTSPNSCYPRVWFENSSHMRRCVRM